MSQSRKPAVPGPTSPGLAAAIALLAQLGLTGAASAADSGPATATGAPAAGMAVARPAEFRTAANAGSRSSAVGKASIKTNEPGGVPDGQESAEGKVAGATGQHVLQGKAAGAAGQHSAVGKASGANPGGQAAPAGLPAGRRQYQPLTK